MVVHSADGMDEISLADATHVAELKGGEINEYMIEPEDFDIERQSVDELVVENAEQSLAIIQKALSGEPGPAADILALNAGAAIYVADRAKTLPEGVKKAQQILQSGDAWNLMQALATHTRTLS